MSSPSSAGGNNSCVGIREGTRVILREITANLQNSPPCQSPRRKSGNEAASIKGEQQHQPQQQQQHDVKVRFIREFADAGASPREAANTESSLSSASSFQSLTSTLSSKCSSGICVDSSPAKATDSSYLSADIPGLEELIAGCEKIRLNDKTLDLSKDQSFNLQFDGEDLSGDQTFTSAVDRNSLDRTRELQSENSPVLNLPPDTTDDLNRTRDLSSENPPAKLPPDFNNQELERTGELELENSAVKLQLDFDQQDLDRTREISAPIVSQELDSTQTIDDETANSTANAFFECAATADNVEASRYRQANSELGSVNETFVQCVSSLEQVDSALEGNARENNLEALEFAKAEESHENLEILVDNRNSDDPQVKKVDNAGISIPSLEDLARNSTISLDSTSDIVADEFDEQRLRKIENVATNRRCEVEETQARSLLDVTVDIPGDLREIEAIETSDFNDRQTTPSDSLRDLVVDISSVDKLEFYEPSAPALSELNENSQCPSLPTLSSVCLRDTLSEAHDLLAQESSDKARSTEENNPAVLVPSLSEKFANIAANDIFPGNSISTIKEPTFLNAQKIADDSVELGEDSSSTKTESATQSVEGVVEIENPHLAIGKNPKNPIELPEIEFCDFKKPEIPAAKPLPKVATEDQLKIENERKGRSETVENVAAEQRISREIVENHEADSSADSEDLNDTVTIQDISAGNIFAVPESDQYAEFLPQQQSTVLNLEQAPTVDFKESGLLPGHSIRSDNSTPNAISLPDEYAAFLPQKQSTTLTGFADQRALGNKLERQPTPFVNAPLPPVEAIFNGANNKNPESATLPVDNRCNFEKLELAAKAVANDIYNTALELEDEGNAPFVTATSEWFQDPGSFDFFLSKTPRKNTRRDLRAESLYVKFDPLVSNTSMLPQGNIQNTSPPANEERNGENNTTISNIGTPKRNPAIAAIDRLLFYSPMTTTTAPTTNTASIQQKTNDSQEKVESPEEEETSAEKVNMAKELELVRSTVIQLEEQLEKLNIEHEEALEKQSSFEEKINQLQTQLAQEIKNKNQITVVVDEYEKSISRLVAERERDRKNLDLEKAKLQEELAAAKHHLDNTEAAFNDVHLKYERLKAVVATYKNNEVALKQSVQENVEIIKSLENRYEQVKEHATARLEKANQDLDAIRKQNESETVRLHAMLRKAELKSNSLAELVEQKTKENKELTQILDEVIARVGRNKSE